MIIDWKDPRQELPPDDAYVAALKYHWKECWPLSVEIIFGQVESYINADGLRVARINTCDFTGSGSYCWNFPIDRIADSDYIVAWTLSKDFKKPSFLNHNSHWGVEK